jgi:hypothetical protein
MSTVFLLVILLVTILVPGQRCSMFGWMKISLITSMFFFFFLMTIIHLSEVTIILYFPLLCHSFGFLVHFFFLATFFWLNALAFDIWSTFRNMRAYGDMIQRIKRKRRRFLYYSVYAWGGPLLIVLVTLVVRLFLLSPPTARWSCAPGTSASRGPCTATRAASSENGRPKCSTSPFPSECCSW